MEIKKENVLAAYETAREAGAYTAMKVLETLFGKETFSPQDVTERIKTFEDACRELGEGHPFVKAFIGSRAGNDRNTADLAAYLKLRIICAALNEGWEPQSTEDESRYYPWFWLYTQDEIDNMDEDDKKESLLMSTCDYQTEYVGFAFEDSHEAPPDMSTADSSRLCLKSEELAVYCGKQFINIWADFCLIRR